MMFFSKKPIRRLFFAFIYVIVAVWVVIDDFAWLNVICSILLVFYGYIAIVKSKIITNKYANVIDDYQFDLHSVFLIVLILMHVMIH